MKNYRLTLNSIELSLLQDLLQDSITNKNKDYFISLAKKVQNPTEIEYSLNKYKASITATEARTKKAKAKIENAINVLRMEGKKITHYAISITGNVSYNTVKKYITDDTIISMNEVK